MNCWRYILALFPAQLLSRRSQKLWRHSGALCVPGNSSSTCGVHSSSQAQRRCILGIPVSFMTNHSDYGYKTVCDYAVLSLYHHVQLMRRINRLVGGLHDGNIICSISIERCSDDVFCRPTCKLASSWFLQQKPNTGFWITAENN